MNSTELTYLVTSIANILSKNYDEDTLTLLAVIFTQLGDTIATILANNQIIISKETQKDEEII